MLDTSLNISFQFDNPTLDYEKLGEDYKSNNWISCDEQECDEDSSTGIPNIFPKKDDNSLFEDLNITKDLYHNIPNDKKVQNRFLLNKTKQERKDYLLKRFKSKLGKYIKKVLNSYNKKMQFVLPDFKQFTQNIAYNDNKKWLNWKIKDILIEYDKKSKKNTKIIDKINNMETSKEVMFIKKNLNKTYEEFANEFINSEDYKCQEMEEYINYVKCNKGFIECMKEIKGNKKKKYDI